SEGVLPMVARMIDDPTKLGGADRALSMTDVVPIFNGMLNTDTISGMVSSRITQEAHRAATYRKDGSRRILARAANRWVSNHPGKVQQIGWGMVREKGPGMARHEASKYLAPQGSPQDGRTPRRFSEQEAQTLVDAGQRLQKLRGIQPTGDPQNDRAQAAMTAATGIIDKSLRGPDGVISAQEAKNVAEAGRLLYQAMGMFYTGLGGTYQQ
ncbi:MAG: hypothetical protein KC910_10455, partial [Candidatus Eremiobacteraeota bacterium]|nr:hypothetical protein [Candidatus Eremiobacteraeota bacterium]